MGIAAILSGESDLIEAYRRTLETLAGHQGPHGEIPSNLDPRTGDVSYGKAVGRVDSTLWFVIGCGQLARATRDLGFLERMFEPLERARYLLGAWEMNARGLIFVPPTGDWADEFLHVGYVLYDQLLYLEAQRTIAYLHREVRGSVDQSLEDQIARLTEMIRASYWFRGITGTPPHVYNEAIFENARREMDAKRESPPYWMPFFSPLGYGFRFDTLANSLVSLLGVADDERMQIVDRYVEDEVANDEFDLLPAFHPVVTPNQEGWKALHVAFASRFRNEPFAYQNGGLWAMVTGFRVADLALRGKLGAARKYLQGIHRANSLAMDGHDWSFPEYVHGRTLQPRGAHPLGWSAAAAVIGHHALEGARIFAR